MKVIGIISSPHFKGNGATLVREALRGAEEAGVYEELIHSGIVAGEDGQAA